MLGQPSEPVHTNRALPNLAASALGLAVGASLMLAVLTADEGESSTARASVAESTDPRALVAELNRLTVKEVLLRQAVVRISGGENRSALPPQTLDSWFDALLAWASAAVTPDAPGSLAPIPSRSPD